MPPPDSLVECPHCEGKGVREERRCRLCCGTGTVDRIAAGAYRVGRARFSDPPPDPENE